jgi:hypothetical protein
VVGCEFTYVLEVCTASIIREMMKTLPISETLVDLYQITRRYNPGDSHIQGVMNFKGCELKLRYVNFGFCFCISMEELRK